MDPAALFYLGLILSTQLAKGYRHLETTTMLDNGAVRFEEEEE